MGSVVAIVFGSMLFAAFRFFKSPNHLKVSDSHKILTLGTQNQELATQVTQEDFGSVNTATGILKMSDIKID